MPLKDKLGPKCSDLGPYILVDFSIAVELRCLVTPKLLLSRILDFLLSNQEVDHCVELMPYYAVPLSHSNLTGHGLVSHPAEPVLHHYLAQAVPVLVDSVTCCGTEVSVHSLAAEVLEFAAEAHRFPHHAATLW